VNSALSNDNGRYRGLIYQAPIKDFYTSLSFFIISHFSYPLVGEYEGERGSYFSNNLIYGIFKFMIIILKNNQSDSFYVNMKRQFLRSLYAYLFY